MVSRVGVIYLAVLLFGLMNAVFVVMAWNREQPMYLRERHVSAYSALNYSLAWGIAEVGAFTPEAVFGFHTPVDADSFSIRLCKQVRNRLSQHELSLL